VLHLLSHGYGAQTKHQGEPSGEEHGQAQPLFAHHSAILDPCNGGEIRAGAAHVLCLGRNFCGVFSSY
jgi:hypothetical protein